MTLKAIQTKRLNGFLGNTTVLSGISTLQNFLKNSGVLDFLKTKSSPRLVGFGVEPHVQATYAAWSAGYMECLEDLMHFQDKFLNTDTEDERASAVSRAMTSNSLKLALDNNDITKEEYDAIIAGRNPTFRPIDASGTTAKQ